MNPQILKIGMRQMSTPSRVTRPHNYPIKNLKKQNSQTFTKSSYYYMYRALIDYKNLMKVKNNFSN